MRIVLIFTILLQFSCLKQRDFTTYVIKKGTDCQKHIPELVGNKLSYTIMFDSSAIYTIDSVEQYDLNKLFGFSACNTHHHENSARFAWRWLNGNLEIHGYIYENGKRDFFFLQNVQINQWNHYYLENTGSNYIFVLNGQNYDRVRMNTCLSATNYELFPCFGGNTLSPHDITIYFK